MIQKENCLRLRALGKSFREISKSLNIPLSTAHLWAKEVKISKAQKLKLSEKSKKALQTGRIKAQKTKKIKYASLVNKNYLLGKKNIGKQLSQHEVTCIGAALYWAEGFKKDNRLGFANSDPQMIRFIIHWLVDILKIPVEQIRLRVGINAYFKKKTNVIEKYWSKFTQIPLNQFQKPFYQTSHTKRIYPDRENYHGVLRIRANGQNHVFRQILGMVDTLKEST